MRPPFLLLMLVALAACSREAPAPKSSTIAGSHTPMTATPATFQAGQARVNLPRTVGPWSRLDAPKTVTAETIFDYMDGGGELYLAYRFDRLDVFEYKAADDSLGTILVELYWMKGPDDALGLLSTDWTGEVPAFDAGAEERSPAIPAHRALYGAGLLRMCRGHLYVRALASRETPQAREAVLAIGRELAATPLPDAAAPPPAVLAALPASPGEGSTLRPDRTCFFRSHLVLNSAYYLASEDILGLGPDVDALTAEYKPAQAGGRPARLIFVRYPSAARARTALSSFSRAYLPEIVSKGASGDSGTVPLEHGWAAWRLKGRDLAIALDGASEAAARRLAAPVIDAAAPPTSSSR